MRYLPRPLELAEVLKRLLDVFGGNRVLFAPIPAMLRRAIGTGCSSRTATLWSRSTCPTISGEPSWAGTWRGSSACPGERMARLDVIAVGELNPDLILGGMPGPPRLGREILAEHCAFTLGSSTALCAANLAASASQWGSWARSATTPSASSSWGAWFSGESTPAASSAPPPCGLASRCLLRILKTGPC